MTVLEVIQRSTEFLTKKGVESPRLQVELLLAQVLGMPRLKLYLNFDRILTLQELDRIRAYVKRRGHREPLQHIVGSTSFCGFEIRVNPSVLVPRPETELLAERSWQFLNQRAKTGGVVTALDFGTGSGCLPIALAKHCPVVKVIALDISLAALDTARGNAERHNLVDRVEWLQSNGFSALPVDQRFDLIISNPPYIPTSEIGTLAGEVKDYDPRLALDGGTDGLDFFRCLAAGAATFLKPGGQLMLEFGDGQEASVDQLLRDYGWQVAGIVPDLSGKPRICIACTA